MAKISKDTPLAEITLRKYEKPNESMTLYEISRRVILSLGLLQPGDSRDVIVDVFIAIITSEGLTSIEIIDKTILLRNKMQASIKGCTSPNIRRQILRLKNSFLIHKHGEYYKINEDEKLVKIWDEHIKGYLLNSINSRIRENLAMLDMIKNKSNN